MAAEHEDAWAAYYEELDPAQRLEIFNILAEQEGENGLLDFRRTLYKERYQDPKHPDRPVDLFLWKCVYLPGLYRRRRLLRAPLQKEMSETLAELHLEQPETLSAEKRNALYLEFRNAARRYLSTCRSAQYGNKFLGLKKATDEEKRKKACEDIWMMSRGIARSAGVEKPMELWCEAFYAELLDFDPGAREYYEELESKFQT